MSALTFETLSAELTQALAQQRTTPPRTVARCTLGRDKVMVLVEYSLEDSATAESFAVQTLDWLEQRLRTQFDTTGLPDEAADLSEEMAEVAVQLYLKHLNEAKPFTMRAFTWKVEDGFTDLFNGPDAIALDIENENSIPQIESGRLRPEMLTFLSDEDEDERVLSELEEDHLPLDLEPDLEGLEAALDDDLGFGTELGSDVGSDINSGDYSEFDAEFGSANGQGPVIGNGSDLDLNLDLDISTDFSLDLSDSSEAALEADLSMGMPLSEKSPDASSDFSLPGEAPEIESADLDLPNINLPIAIPSDNTIGTSDFFDLEETLSTVETAVKTDKDANVTVMEAPEQGQAASEIEPKVTELETVGKPETNVRIDSQTGFQTDSQTGIGDAKQMADTDERGNIPSDGELNNSASSSSAGLSEELADLTNEDADDGLAENILIADSGVEELALKDSVVEDLAFEDSALEDLVAGDPIAEDLVTEDSVTREASTAFTAKPSVNSWSDEELTDGELEGEAILHETSLYGAEQTKSDEIDPDDWIPDDLSDLSLDPTGAIAVEDAAIDGTGLGAGLGPDLDRADTRPAVALNDDFMTRDDGEAGHHETRNTEDKDEDPAYFENEDPTYYEEPNYEESSYEEPNYEEPNYKEEESSAYYLDEESGLPEEYEDIAAIDESEVQRQREQWQEQTKGNRWALVGTFGLLLLGVLGFIFTRPCTIGTCDRIEIAQQQGNTALNRLGVASSLAEVSEIKDQLDESVDMLKPIPVWSSYHNDAQAILPGFEQPLTALDLVTQAQGTAYSAALKSLDPPHPTATWETVASEWREAITMLSNIPLESPVRGIAERKLTEYRANLSTILVRIETESEAEVSLRRAQSAASQATQQAKQADSLDAWEAVLVGWSEAVSSLRQIPQGTQAYNEAQQILPEYEDKRLEARDRVEQERSASRILSQAQQLAIDAQSAEAEEQWSAAADNWTQAALQLGDIPSGSLAYTAAQNQLATYTVALDAAEANAAVSLRFQPVEPSFYLICSASDVQKCTYALKAGKVRLDVAKGYDSVINESITPPDQRSEIETDAQLISQSNQLLEQVALLSGQSQIPVELYGSEGDFLARYQPDLAGFVRQ